MEGSVAYALAFIELACNCALQAGPAIDNEGAKILVQDRISGMVSYSRVVARQRLKIDRLLRAQVVHENIPTYIKSAMRSAPRQFISTAI